MSAKLCLVGCHNFHKEVCAAIKTEDWTDAVAVDFPARCGRPPITWDELRPLLPDDCTQMLVLGRACIAGLQEPGPGFPPARLLPQKECFHMAASPGLVAEAIGAGGYLMTPGWLANWRERIADMGFTPETAGEFFKDFAQRLVLLDTGVDPEAVAQLGEMSKTVGLPATRIAVGLDQTRMLLARAVLEWRLDTERSNAREHERRHAREMADLLSSMDLLPRLTEARQESEAIAAIRDLFQMLFAPSMWHYVRVERGRLEAPQDIPAALLKSLEELRTTYAWTPSGEGFMLRIGRADQALGLIVADHFAFPAYRERYLNLALSVIGICALAIENSRNRKRLIEAEKMASLGIMVAGVAHEINTPVGVGLVAASTLQEQSRSIARRFAERSMTQSDLQGYLDTAQTEAGMIRSNLERIGHLTDSFRQVAVNGKPPEKRHIHFKACIDDVVASLGDRVPADRVAIRVLCDESLEIESYPGDWASIFTNLISNSIQHGFNGRGHGSIEVNAAKTGGQLVVDYADDGAGLTPEAQAHIFDPFFTTDMQNGIGLGMHLVYNLVTQRLGGHIACDNRAGKGAHFHIDTPL